MNFSSPSYMTQTPPDEHYCIHKVNVEQPRISHFEQDDDNLRTSMMFPQSLEELANGKSIGKKRCQRCSPFKLQNNGGSNGLNGSHSSIHVLTSPRAHSSTTSAVHFKKQLSGYDQGLGQKPVVQAWPVSPKTTTRVRKISGEKLPYLSFALQGPFQSPGVIPQSACSNTNSFMAADAFSASSTNGAVSTTTPRKKKSSTTLNQCISETNFPGKDLVLSSCGGHQTSSMNEEGIDSQQGTLESTDGHYTVSAFASRAEGGLRNIYYFYYEPIVEENESKLSSEGEIRTDRSNTDESFEIDLEQYINFCDEPNDVNPRLSMSGGRNLRAYSQPEVQSSSCATETTQKASAEQHAINEPSTEDDKPVMSKRQSFIESLRGQLGGEVDTNLNILHADGSNPVGGTTSDKNLTSNNDDEREGTMDHIEISLLDRDESASGDLDDPSTNCQARKRIFSSSDVELNPIDGRKKINPFSSALSAAPYYFHDFKTNDKKQDNHHHKAFAAEVNAGSSHLQINEFHPTATPFFPQHKAEDAQSIQSSFSGANGIPMFSESLTLNDATTAQGNQVSNWKTSAPEFVPKGINQLAAQGQLPSQLSQLPVNATAETAFLKCTFGHQNAAASPAGQNSYLEFNHVEQAQVPASSQDNHNNLTEQFAFNQVAPGGPEFYPNTLGLTEAQLEALRHPGQSEKFQTMYKNEMCRNWEKGYCQYGHKCTFAHGRHELQDRLDIPQNYKTKLCEKFHGPEHHCPYGQRCTFVHLRPGSASQSGSGTKSQTSGAKGLPKEAVKKPPSRADNLNLIIGQISARGDPLPPINLALPTGVPIVTEVRNTMPSTPVAASVEPAQTPHINPEVVVPEPEPTASPMAPITAVGSELPPQLIVTTEETAIPATAGGSDQTTEHVQMAQKLFKRYGGRRLEVFKSIQHAPPQSLPVEEMEPQMMPLQMKPNPTGKRRKQNSSYSGSQNLM